MRIICSLFTLIPLMFLVTAFTTPIEALKAFNVHFNSLVVDSHNDTMLKIVDTNTLLPIEDIGKDTNNHVDLPKLKVGGINVSFFAAYAEEHYGNVSNNISRTLSLINALYWTEQQNPRTLRIPDSARDIDAIVNTGKIVAIPTIEGGYSLDENNGMELLKQYHDLGIKVLGFTWNTSNALGEGVSRIYGDSNETPSIGGLTRLGKDILKEMNRLGMVVDVSHMAESTFWDVIENSKGPVMATHSGVYSLRNHPRNLTDAQLKALAKNGGVIGIVLYPDFLVDGYPDETAYIRDYVDHIDYVVKLIGVDHVGLGSDFDGATLPIDIRDASQMYKITEELISRGYAEKDIKKILGENTLRVLEEVEELAEESHLPNSGLRIKHSYAMGDGLPNDTSVFTARIDKDAGVEVNYSSIKVILDGILYIPEYKIGTSHVSFQLDEPLGEKFHVLTFEAREMGCIPVRETIIFYFQ